MSRKIDLTQELSDDDRQYLVDRSRFLDLQLNQQYLNGDDFGEPDRLPNPGTNGQDASPNAVPASVGAQSAADSATAPGSANPADADSAASGGEGSGDTDADDNYEDEEAWPYSDLKDEVKSLNENLPEGERQALNGSREDLIAFLRKHDEG